MASYLASGGARGVLLVPRVGLGHLRPSRFTRGACQGRRAALAGQWRPALHTLPRFQGWWRRGSPTTSRAAHAAPSSRPRAQPTGALLVLGVSGQRGAVALNPATPRP
eukprot:scaffold603_cov404-Prasinococcus_capsulatus_cf.AAC.27